MAKIEISFTEARWYTKVSGKRKVRLIVFHDMEAPEKGDTAEAIANYFARGTVKASAHFNIDNNSIVQGVPKNDVAYAAPGANHDGLQLEHAGYAKQKRREWLDPYGRDMLALSAWLVARLCHEYGIPPVHLTNEELREGKKGIVSHAQVSAVYKQSSHTDPGPNFPWGWYLRLVQAEYNKITDNKTLILEQLKESARKEPGNPSVRLHPGQVRLLGRLLKKEGLLSERQAKTTHFSRAKKRAYKAWQRRNGATKAQATGIPGRASLSTLATKHGVSWRIR